MLQEASNPGEESAKGNSSSTSISDTLQLRKIIVHYHLFKNAGSSVDHLLKKAYADGQWVNHDPGEPPHMISSSELL